MPRRLLDATGGGRWRAGATAGIAAGVLLALANPEAGAAAPAMTVLSPLPRQVVQRVGDVPSRAHHNEPGGPAFGHAEVPVELEFVPPAGATLEYRTSLLKNATGKAVAWSPLPGKSAGSRFAGAARVPAGGWYRLEFRCAQGGQVLAEGAVEPFGVGEVFVISGQSNSGCPHEEKMRVEDPEGRVVAYDMVKGTWDVAHDPQPNGGLRGSIWVPMCNALLPVLRVPIGMINAGGRASPSSRWLPGADRYREVEAAGKAAGRFRALLWQQGESDVIENTPAETYVRNLTSTRAGWARAWGFEPVWMPAKSTLHPAAYTRPDQEAVIRSAIAQLWETPGFRPGPDTDVLGGENRGGPAVGNHFSAIGQRRAGLLWFAAVLNEIERQSEAQEGRK